jgi:hypothetical protein
MISDLIEMEDLPKNVSMSFPGIKISEFPLDCLYNNKMEQVRGIFRDKFLRNHPIEIILMKSESI